MANFVKWIGGGIGFYVYGPTGGLLGFLVGSFLDEAITINHSVSEYRPAPGGNFRMSLVILVAAVMNADGKVVKAELDFAKQFFVRQFGHDGAVEAVGSLKDLLKRNVQIGDACFQVRARLEYSSRIQLLHVLFNLASSDSMISSSEIYAIEIIAGYLGISAQDFNSIKNIFVSKTESSYKILEIDPSFSNDEVKKAYRKLAMQYHPDKVNHLGEEKRKEADDKFKKVNEAYDIIKKERAMV